MSDSRKEPSEIKGLGSELIQIPAEREEEGEGEK